MNKHTEHTEIVKCFRCESRATEIVNDYPYCEVHARQRASWLLENEGVVSRFISPLGFTWGPRGEYLTRRNEHD